MHCAVSLPGRGGCPSSGRSTRRGRVASDGNCARANSTAAGSKTLPGWQWQEIWRRAMSAGMAWLRPRGSGPACQRASGCGVRRASMRTPALPFALRPSTRAAHPLARYAAQVRWLVHGLWLEPCAWRAWRPEPALWPRCLGGIAKREPDREPDPGSLAEPHLAAGEVLVGPHRLRLTGVTSNEQAVATIERQWRGPDSQAAPCTKALWPAGPLG